VRVVFASFPAITRLLSLVIPAKAGSPREKAWFGAV